MSVLTSTDSNFARDTSQGLVLVDFWAPWCGPCQMMGPILEDLAKQIGDRARIMKHNVDNEPNIAQQLAIRSIPTMILFKDGVIIERTSGVHSVTDLVSLLQKHM
ncbi:MAG: thioredoxin [Candidatus Gracilibacteria bacterium]